MRRALCLGALALAGGLAACALGPATRHAAPSDAALQQALMGLWCNSEDGGRHCWALDEFSPPDRFRACGQAEGDSRPFHGEGRFEVQGRRLCYTVTAASENFWLPTGARYCTEILSMAESQHRWRDLDTGAEFTLWRRPAADRRCPGAPPVQ